MIYVLDISLGSTSTAVHDGPARSRLEGVSDSTFSEATRFNLRQRASMV